MKFLFDLFPILLFFIAFKIQGIYVATAVAIAASCAQVGWFWLRHRRVETMHLVTLALIVVLGGATLWLHNETFIKWKPTAVYWVLAVVFLASQYLSRRPLIERMLGETITLPEPIWHRLNLAWVIFFVALGIANLYVVYQFDTNTWVNFKLFGMTALLVMFSVAQGFYLARHMKDENLEKEGE